MPRFVVSSTSLHDNEVMLEIVDAPDDVIAITRHSMCDWLGTTEVHTVEAYQACAFDADQLIGVIEI